MMVGLPGAGKTTKAKVIETQYNAVHFTPDEWILTLYDHRVDKPHMDEVRDPVEQLQWQIAQRFLVLGQNVILDCLF